jgi:hypothetical protein
MMSNEHKSIISNTPSYSPLVPRDTSTKSRWAWESNEIIENLMTDTWLSFL